MRAVLCPHYDVIVARNGEEAWELFNSEKPDLVLSDAVMPRMNGLDLLRKIRLQSYAPETPVIMVTASTRGTDLADGFWNMGAGASGFISKPFSPLQVLEAVRSHLPHPDAERT